MGSWLGLDSARIKKRQWGKKRQRGRASGRWPGGRAAVSMRGADLVVRSKGRSLSKG